MGSALTVRTHSNENVSGSTDCNAFTGSIEEGLPIALGLTKRGSAFATVSYLANFGGEHQRVIGGDVGVRWAW